MYQVLVRGRLKQVYIIMNKLGRHHLASTVLLKITAWLIDRQD